MDLITIERNLVLSLRGLVRSSTGAVSATERGTCSALLGVNAPGESRTRAVGNLRGYNLLGRICFSIVKPQTGETSS